MSEIITLSKFVIGFATFMFASGWLDNKVVLGLVLVSALGLYIVGPDTFLFGMILATGWRLLNIGVERIFPIEN